MSCPDLCGCSPSVTAEATPRRYALWDYVFHSRCVIKPYAGEMDSVQGCRIGQQVPMGCDLGDCQQVPAHTNIFLAGLSPSLRLRFYRQSHYLGCGSVLFTCFVFLCQWGRWGDFQMHISLGRFTDCIFYHLIPQQAAWNRRKNAEFGARKTCN